MKSSSCVLFIATVVWFFCSECSLELLGLTKSLCSLRIFKVLHTVQFSRFFVVERCRLFSAATFISYHNCFCLSTTFFIFLISFFETTARFQQLEYHIITFIRCQHLFWSFSNNIFNRFFFKKENGERGIWTLAPVARPTPLAGAPLRPLEYFSAVIT